MQQQLQEKDVQLQERDIQLQERDTQLQEKDTQLQERDTQLQDLQDTLLGINTLVHITPYCEGHATPWKSRTASMKVRVGIQKIH